MIDGQVDSGTAVAAPAAVVVATPAAPTAAAPAETGLNIANAVDSISADLGFGEAKPAEKVAPVEAVATTPPPATPAAEAVPAPTGAPKTWKPEEAAVWASIPSAAQAAITRREEDMFKGLEGYKVQAQFGSTVQQAIQPFMAVMQAHGIDPVQNISSLMNAHYTLATGTEAQKTQLFQQLAKDYSVKLAPTAASGAPAYVDPEVQQLRDELAQLKGGQNELQRQRYQEVQERTAATVNAFANDPKNIHFADVGPEIARLLNLDKNLTLEKAYETAVWANPVTRAKEIARQDAEKQTNAQREAKEALERSKAATAANLKVQPKAGAATLPLGTMDETMAETLREIKSRQT